MTLQSPRGTRPPARHNKGGKAAHRPTWAKNHGAAPRSNSAKGSRVPDYLVYEVRRAIPKDEWPLIGRASAADSGNTFVTCVARPKRAVLLRPLWSHLTLGKQEWNRPPDYAVLEADADGCVICTARCGDAWDQTRGTIFINLNRRPPETIVLRRIGSRRTAAQTPTNGGWGDDGE
jgi:hypothetical protein